MRLSTAIAASLLTQHFLTANVAHAIGNCAPDPLEYSDTMALKIEKVGSIPTNKTDPFSYNMQPMDNFDGDVIYFLDQIDGKIYSYEHSSSAIKKIFDMATSAIPEGLTLDFASPGAGAHYRVKSMTKGSSSDEVVVVFASSTLPPGWSVPDSKLPPPGAYGSWYCKQDPSNNIEMAWVEDIYRPGVVPACAASGGGFQTIQAYDVFYKYKLVNGELLDPSPFFVSEVNVSPGHYGGGIVTLEDGTILWSVGDCLMFGHDGYYAPQMDNESCGKILRLYPKTKGKFSIVAKGVRNSQQMRMVPDSAKTGDNATVFPTKAGKVPKSKAGKTGKNGKVSKDSYVSFMDIGGVTAEEVNAVSVEELLYSSKLANFGWGRNQDDGKAREGTFYVEAGIGGVLGTEPPCASNAPIGEDGFKQPWIQFGRTVNDYFYAISSLALPTSGVDKLKLLWSEFNTGIIMGSDQPFVEGAPPVTGYKLKLYDSSGNLLTGINDLVQSELGSSIGFTSRGDARLFHFPDGSPGVFIERTGLIYKLTEITPS